MGNGARHDTLAPGCAAGTEPTAPAAVGSSRALMLRLQGIPGKQLPERSQSHGSKSLSAPSLSAAKVCFPGIPAVPGKGAAAAPAGVRLGGSHTAV